MAREFTPEWRAKLSEAAKRRHKEGRNGNLKRGGAHMANEAHPFWKGDHATMAPLHQWIKRHRTKTGTCSHCGRTPPPVRYMRGGKPIVAAGTDWANVSGRYDRLDESDWIELCRRCHAHLDGFVKNLKPQRGEKHYAARLTSADVAEIRRRYSAGGITQAQLAREFEVGKAHLSAIVRGKKRRHG